MPEIAFLFPGQGSQTAGMVKALAPFPEAREVFRQAGEFLEFDIWDLCLRGPEEVLSQDDYAQLAVHVTNCAYHRVLSRMNLAPKMASGFSLGIFSALFASGSLTFEQGLEGVRFAAENMSEEGRNHPGAMAAVIGLSEGEVKEVCQEVSRVFVASVNNPQQIVISGVAEEVEKAISLCVRRGALLVKRLPIGWAIHTPLMEAVCRDFSDKIRDWRIGVPRFPVLSYLRGEFLGTPEELKAELSAQFSHPNHWHSVLLKMRQEGIGTYLEVGPGKVLTQMVRWVHRSGIAVTAEEVLARGGLPSSEPEG